MDKNSRELMELARQAEELGYNYCSFCEEVSAWGEKNDPDHDGWSPTDYEMEHARQKLVGIRDSRRR